MVKLDINVGDQFGDWTVIDTNRFSKNGHVYVQCQCKCGKISDIAATALKRGKTNSCRSCAARKTTKLLKPGDKYKHWTILEGPIYIKGTAYYKVQCDCGTIEFKLPIEILSKDNYFQCEKCAHSDNMKKIKIKNGAIGELSKTEYTRYKRSAEKRGLEFAVSIEYLWNLFVEQKQICAITGDYISCIKDASLDRIDSSKGYIEGNVQWVTKQANLSKHIMTMPELIEFCKKTLNHANQQPSSRLTSTEGSETNGWNSNWEHNTDTSAEYPENTSG